MMISLALCGLQVPPQSLWSEPSLLLHLTMASEQQMKNPLLVGTAIRAQLEHQVPQDLPLLKDFRERSDYTITDQ